ncbi:MAG TPA: phage portal protein [Candidatus Krumholzibacteria bacterium]|nr:phage portal protein [Candidatus Krumholzibacteria bacterium]HPD73524.1 phage portal protein [Candidatus Krumholzibacteria bacterium]HRY42246.1 phage portal protein [Candidatus Krumholzibacteria bacterium]
MKVSLGHRIKLAVDGFRLKAAQTYNYQWLHGGLTSDILGGGAAVAVANAYANSAIAYACIDRMSKDAAGVPLMYLSDPKDAESAAPDGDPVSALFTSPNQVMSSRRLIGWTVMMRQLRGECFWTFDLTTKQPKAIFPWFDPSGWHEKVDSVDGLYGWDFRKGETKFSKIAGDVLWMGQDDPTNPYRGQSPLKAASRALSIDIYGDTLQENMLARGGERGLVFEAEWDPTPDQYDQLLARLATRRPGAGQSSRDFVVTNGLKLANPAFTREDIDILAQQNASKDKICHVYGMAPVLIGDDDSAQYKSAPEATKVYWQQTLVPLLHSLEDAWDQFFVNRRGLGTYVRFDLSKVPALQEDAEQQARIAKQYWDMLLPFAAINDKLGLGFDDETVAAVDGLDIASRKPQPAAPAQTQQPAGAPAKSKAYGRLTNAEIKARANDSRFRIQRNRMLAKLERKTMANVREVGAEYQTKTLDAVKDALEQHGTTNAGVLAAQLALDEFRLPFGTDLSEKVAPSHAEAAEIGAASVQELVDGEKMAWHDRRKAISFAPNTVNAMAQRRAWLRQYTGPGWIDEIKELVAAVVEAAGEEGASIGTVVGKIREGWGAWTRSQVETIARTEVGTMYNTSRVEEMGQQEFTKHEWVTSIDEATRTSHEDVDGQIRNIGDPFDLIDKDGNPVRMAHPQESGAPAEEVINCRCETIPVVED